jgi:2-amino-4-hydroxy-6-hydroxymethyldihydropteridine diphosphokinase
MTAIYLGVGSNVDRHKNITAALDALADLLGELVVSSVYESKSVGFDGSHFFNLVVGADTDLSIVELSEKLKRIEDNNGRKRNGPKFSPRTLDIDILTFGDLVGVEEGIELPRAEIIHNAFVLLPMSQIAPQVLHPQLRKTYSDLWGDYDQASQSLWAIEFEWRGKKISAPQ